MARLIQQRDLTPIFNAFAKWRDGCLVQDGSLFSTASLWTPENVAEVKRAFVDNPDESAEDFTTKLKGQMRIASPPSQQLMAEMLWALLLFPSNVNPSTKRRQIREIWALSGQDLQEGLPLLSDNILGGIGSGGPGFNNHRWRELVFLITLTGELKGKTETNRRYALEDYDAFLDWITRVPQQGSRQFRHMLRFLAFPDRVERISTNGDRRAILEGFSVAPERETKSWSDKKLDQALLDLREKLQRENPGAVLDFYEPPLRPRWRRRNEDGSLSADLEAVLAGYGQAKKTQSFGKRAPMYQLFERIEDAFRKCQPVRRRPSVHVVASAGQGNWVDVPWISFLDSRETATTQSGVYGVYLFREDMSGVYLTFNQGVTRLTKESGWRSAEASLKDTANRLRAAFPELPQQGFSFANDIELRAHGDLGQMYEVSTIAYKFYETGHVPEDDELLGDLDRLLGVYGRYVDSKRERPPEGKAWIFQGNPEYFDLIGALAQLREMTWLARQHVDAIHSGDRVFLWQSGDEAGVVALATVLADPEPIEQPSEERGFNRSDMFDGVQPRARMRIDRVLANRIDRTKLLGHPVLGSLGIITSPRGTNYPVSKAQADALMQLIGTVPRPPAGPIDLQRVTEEFGSALVRSHVSFGARHDMVVRSFVASLAAKRFAILTGLSGSGKTQLGMRFGEWFGENRSLVVPVRPDWTGAEALFGYEDVLREPLNGRSAWHVPEALRFMLRAAADPENPYLLLLDEMNLAHVERYFADALSGMESDQACLPNLKKEANGAWRIPANEVDKLPIPENLFVVGTVNVDETTYMFSPKVLDRANTFEFRVGTSELLTGQTRPVPVEPGHPDLVTRFLAVAANPQWHLEHPAPGQGVFVEHLRRLHALLSNSGFEFGHRIFYEAIRFAAMYAAAGDDDPLKALDLQIMQKVLPRLHGSRRRLELTLCAVGRFCHDLSYVEGDQRDAVSRFSETQQSPSAAQLAISYDKVSRMVSNLRANQFVSFTE